MSDRPKNPAQRKAEAREALDCDLNLLPDCDCGEEAMRMIDAYARACIDEAVAPALEYIDARLAMLDRFSRPSGSERDTLIQVRRLLTEGSE